MTLAAYQGRCPTCGHDTSKDAAALEEYRQWLEKRLPLEDGLEVGVGWSLADQLAAPDAPLSDKQVGMEAREAGRNEPPPEKVSTTEEGR